MATSSSARADPFVSSNSSQTSWLLPSNRKLRNIVSICLRNLTTSTNEHARERGKTIDDDAIPNTLHSPAKIVALREQRYLAHTRSSTDLRSVAEVDTLDSHDSVDDGRTADGPSASEAQKTPTKSRPLQRPVRRLRRSSTLEWANASPQKRQERLEQATTERMVDVFFSFHVKGVEAPIYVSEMIKQTINPTFGAINVMSDSPSISRLSHLTIHVWARDNTSRPWKQLIMQNLDLQSLHYLGPQLETCDHVLPRNALIVEMTDGWYTTSKTTSKHIESPTFATKSAEKTSRSLPTSSFDALLRLAKLDDSIQDAIVVRNQLVKDLETVVEKSNESYNERDCVAELGDRLKTIEFAKSTVQRQLDKARLLRSEKQKSIQLRRTQMAADVQNRDVANRVIQEAARQFPVFEVEHQVKQQAIHSQRRRICEELQTFYPVEPNAKQSLAFSICKLHLPNSDNLDSESPEQVAAALGHVTSLLMLLSFHLDRPLPYPVRPKGSNSTIYDPLSLLKTNVSASHTYKDETNLRTYPLFSKGVPRFRFDYAVFLLNKNIQTLLESTFGVRVLDIRHTLPNLKYLLYIATAGEGELPARKAGGVRGLFRSRLAGDARPHFARHGSQDSTSSSWSASMAELKTTAAAGKVKTNAVDSLRQSAKAMSGGQLRK